MTTWSEHPIAITETFRVKGRGRGVVFSQENLPTEVSVGAIVRQDGHEWPVSGTERWGTGKATGGVLCRAVFGGPEPHVGAATIQLVGDGEKR